MAACSTLYDEAGYRSSFDEKNIRRELKRLLLQVRLKHAREEEQRKRRGDIARENQIFEAKRQEVEDETRELRWKMDQLYHQALQYWYGSVSVAKDESKTAKLFQQAAEFGHADCQYHVGYCFEVWQSILLKLRIVWQLFKDTCRLHVYLDIYTAMARQLNRTTNKL